MTTNPAAYVYRMAYPIEDDTLRISQVMNQATLVFPDHAEERGFRLLSDPQVWIDGDEVHCEAAAEIIEGRKPRLADIHGWQVLVLNGAGKTDREIADDLGLPLRTARRIRTELGLPSVKERP